jgi:hypothetical protein
LQLNGTEGTRTLYDFTSLKNSDDGSVLIENGGYGRAECVQELVQDVAAGGRANRPGSKAVSLREARNAQRLLDTILASDGEWLEVQYGDSDSGGAAGL